MLHMERPMALLAGIVAVSRVPATVKNIIKT
jgi:hypothetical protein